DQLSRAADFHAHQPFVPALDHLPRTDRYWVWLPAFAAVELLAVFESTRVVDFDAVPGSDRRAVADLLVHVLQAGRGGGPLFLFSVGLVFVLVVLLRGGRRRGQPTAGHGNGEQDRSEERRVGKECA